MTTATAITISEKEQIRRKVSKPLLWVGIGSIVMLFAGLTSAYIVAQHGRFWVKTELPQMFVLSTVVIIISSITMNMALLAAKKNNGNKLKSGMLLTMLFGFGFVACQYVAWGELVQGGKFFVGNVNEVKGEYGKGFTIAYNGMDLIYSNEKYYMPGDTEMKTPVNNEMLKSFNASSSFLYVLSGLHVAHLAGGIIALMIVFFNALNNKYNAENLLGLQLCSTYWHFLDGLWIYLFLFLNFIR